MTFTEKRVVRFLWFFTETSLFQTDNAGGSDNIRRSATDRKFVAAHRSGGELEVVQADIVATKYPRSHWATNEPRLMMD